jgi:hypothetical protein
VSEFALVKVEKRFKDGKPTCEGCELRMGYEYLDAECVITNATVRDGVPVINCPVHFGEPNRVLKDAIDYIVLGYPKRALGKIKELVKE